MNRREFMAAALAAPVSAQSRATAILPRPNVLFILADDLGYGDLSCYGRPDYRTPVLDMLAREGLRFTNAYAAAPVCTPTRVGFQTGRYPHRLELGLYEPLPDINNELGIPVEHPTISSLLKGNGYETALIGKWHLGNNPRFSPNNHGFEEFFGIVGSSQDFFTHKNMAGKMDLFENGRPFETDGYLTDVLTDRAVQFLARRRTRPFYLSLHYNAPHWPWEGPKDSGIDHNHTPYTEGGSLEVYAEMVKSMDQGIGRVLKALRESRLDRNTLIVFTSDNGGERYSYNWPFSLQKFNLWEGGIRVPAIVRWTGVVPAGRTTDQPAITMDWSATILSLSGTAPHPQYPLDGQDLLPVCTGARPVFERTFFWRNRVHDAARIGKWKYLKENNVEHLFDLSRDPGEKAEMKVREPGMFERIRSAYQQWNSDVLPRLSS